tara:strand:- start:5489 stop:6070 length:582 start_codon:yes stop_codon:yes gene_type:complete
MGSIESAVFDDLAMGDPDERLVQTAKERVGTDNYVNTSKRDVCVKCMRNIFSDTNIPFPETNNVVTFMDAIEGNKVDLFNNPKDSNGNRVKQRYSGRKHWEVITDANNLKAGDVMIVHNNEGGLHATMITSLTGDTSSTGVLSTWYTGINVIHDPGKGSATKSSHYEWHELNNGEGRSNLNRKFKRAYRYKGG